VTTPTDPLRRISEDLIAQIDQGILPEVKTNGDVAALLRAARRIAAREIASRRGVR
jgi:hypothetical protein